MGFRSQPWVSSHWGQFGRKQTKPLQAAAAGSATVGGCGRLWEVPQDSKAPLIPAWGLGTGTQGTAALSLLVSASLRCLPPGALDPRPP